MKKQILGMVLFTMLITTILPSMLAIDVCKTEVTKKTTVNIKHDNEQKNLNGFCGTAWIILRGNESCMIGARIQLKNSFGILVGERQGLTIPLFGRVQGDVELIEDPGNPFQGWYGCEFQVCGFYQIDYIPPAGKDCSEEFNPYISLVEDQEIETYIILDINSE